MRPRPRILVTLAFTIVAGISGCGPSGYVLAPVSGRVTIDGEPVGDVRIAFEPIADETRKIPGPESIAITDEDGRFRLYTTDEERRGAVVGKCRVRIWTVPGAAKDGRPAVITDDRDPNYDAMAEIRALKAQIRAGASKKAAKTATTGIIPFRFNDQSELTFEVPPQGTDKADFAISWK